MLSRERAELESISKREQVARLALESERKARAAAEESAFSQKQELAGLQAKVDAILSANKEEKDLEKNRSDRERRRRDWGRVATMLALVSAILAWLGFVWAFSALAAFAAIAFLWTSIAEDPPPVGLSPFTLAVGIITAFLAALEKQPDWFRHSQQPAPIPSVSGASGPTDTPLPSATVRELNH